MLLPLIRFQLDEPSIFTEDAMKSIMEAVEENSMLETLKLMVKLGWSVDQCGYTEHVVPQCVDFAPDIMVIDGSHPCPYIWAEKLGIPHITFVPFQPLQPILSIQHGVPMSAARWPATGSGYNPYAPSFLSRLNNQLTTYVTATVWGMLSEQASFAKAGMPELSYSGTTEKERGAHKP
jgi:hypothetical protein